MALRSVFFRGEPNESGLHFMAAFCAALQQKIFKP